jgi:abhydrolase domain-containing protein 13
MYTYVPHPDNIWPINRWCSWHRSRKPKSIQGGTVPLFRLHHSQESSSSQIQALILENTFTSLPRLIPTALPLLSPFSFLCHQKWDSASKVPLIPTETPILMLSGARDEVVPKEHMRNLWEIVKKRGEKGKSKFLEFEDGSHSKSGIAEILVSG